MKKNNDFRLSLSLFPRSHIILLGGLLLLLITGQLLLKEPSTTTKKERPHKVAVKNDAPLKPKAINIEDTWKWRTEKVLNGDSLSQIFSRLNLSAIVLDKVLSSDEQAKELTKLYPGEEIRFAFDDQQQLVAIEYAPSKLETLKLSLSTDNSFKLEYTIKEPEVRLTYRKASLQNSLFLDGNRAGLSQATIMQIANIFSGVIDFALDTRKGDSFDALYEEKYVDDKYIGAGRLLAASYTNEKETFTAYRYEFEDGTASYFNPEGISMRKTFLRAPLDFTRVSSEFNLRRMHPVHKKIRAHRGIDYSAPTGTPVYAAGDGRVSKAGYSPANGNFVFIAHNNQYMTKYLHFHKRFVKTGQRVKQGDVIGTVGSTGYATGPHLHYEFLLNGVHRNPRSIAKLLPPADPIPKKDKERFVQQVKTINLEYDKYKTAQANIKS
jgi:murein DD-endopeptidase MepM/ murein hydrolase activator NlpD